MMPSILYARISDEVLDPHDWPIRKLAIEDGRVIHHQDVALADDAYPLSSFTQGPTTGWDMDQLLAWLRNATHPTEHDLRADVTQEYRWVQVASELEDMVKMGACINSDGVEMYVVRMLDGGRFRGYIKYDSFGQWTLGDSRRFAHKFRDIKTAQDVASRYFDYTTNGDLPNGYVEPF